MTASNKALFAQLPAPIGSRLTTQGTADGTTAELIFTAGPQGGCIKRLSACTVGTAVSAATAINIFIEVGAGPRINRAPIALPARAASANSVLASQPEATPENPIEVPPNAKVYAAVLGVSAGVSVDIWGDAFTYTKADAA